MSEVTSLDLSLRIAEFRIDQIILDALSGADSGRLFLEAIDLHGRVLNSATMQKKHFGASGTIDIHARLDDNSHLLIENKIDARFNVTKDHLSQPERYIKSVQTLKGYGTAAYSVLVAPENYLASTSYLSSFDKSLSYEALAKFLDGDNRKLLERAIEQASEPYVPIPALGNMRTFAAIYALAETEFPDLHLKSNPNAKDVRPKESVTVYVDAPKTLKAYSDIPNPSMSLQLRQTGAKIMLSGLADAVGHVSVPEGLEMLGGTLAKAGKSLGIKLETPRVFVDKAPDDQIGAMLLGLSALDQLREWWNENEYEVRELHRAAKD